MFAKGNVSITAIKISRICKQLGYPESSPHLCKHKGAVEKISLFT